MNPPPTTPRSVGPDAGTSEMPADAFAGVARARPDDLTINTGAQNSALGGPRKPAAAPSSDDGPPPTVVDPKVGMTLRKYKLLARLGKGGMGIVYEAEDTTLGRRVAVKLLLPDCSANPELLKRFRAEARAAARLNHPHCVAVHEVDSVGSDHFIVMELVDGGSVLDLLLSGRPPDWRAATLFIADACRGLAAAHEAGLLHRDIKPGNLLRTRDGLVKVADFGLAKLPPGAAGSLATSTTTGAVLGTPEYMSPEQAWGKTLDRRSDLYALGATYYTLLTARLPYEKPTPVQVLYAHCNEPPPDPRMHLADLPEGVAAVIRKAMAKDPDQRYPDAPAMLADLEALLGGASTSGVRRLGTAGLPPRLPAPAVPTAAAPGTAADDRTVVHGSTAPGTRNAQPSLPGKGPLLLIAAAAVVFFLGSAVLLLMLRWGPGKEHDDSQRPPDSAKTGDGAGTGNADPKPGTRDGTAAGTKDGSTKDGSTKDVGPKDMPPPDGPPSEEQEEAWQRAADAQFARLSAELAGRNPTWKSEGAIHLHTRGRLSAVQLSADGLTDIAPLARIPELQAVFLKGASANSGTLADLSPLAGLPRLNQVEVSDTAVADLRPLATLPVLRILVLKNCPVRDLGPLREARELRSLDITGTPVPDLTALARLQLEWIHLGGTSVDSLAPLAGMPLIDIVAPDTKVRDLGPVRGRTLRKLVLSRSPVADLSPLAECPQLIELRIDGTEVTSLEPLRKIGLLTLALQGSDVADPRPLADMPVQDLWLDDPIRWLPTLARMRRLILVNGKPAREIPGLRVMQKLPEKPGILPVKPGLPKPVLPLPES